MDDYFETTYRQHVDAVFRFAWRTVRRRDLAEDLTSEAFIALLRHRDRVPPNRLLAWLFAVVKNGAVDFWRHATIERRHAAAGGGQDHAGRPEDPLEWLLGVTTLTQVHRVCLRLRYAHDMSLAEIAKESGLSKTQVKGHLQHGRARLRRALVTKPR